MVPGACSGGSYITDHITRINRLPIRYRKAAHVAVKGIGAVRCNYFDIISPAGSVAAGYNRSGIASVDWRSTRHSNIKAEVLL